MYCSELAQTDTASLGENSVLLAVPSPHIIASVRLLEVSPADRRGWPFVCAKDGSDSDVVTAGIGAAGDVLL